MLRSLCASTPLWRSDRGEFDSHDVHLLPQEYLLRKFDRLEFAWVPAGRWSSWGLEWELGSLWDGDSLVALYIIVWPDPCFRGWFGYLSFVTTLFYF